MEIKWKRDSVGFYFGYVGDSERPRFLIKRGFTRGENGWLAYDLSRQDGSPGRYFGILKTAKSYCASCLKAALRQG